MILQRIKSPSDRTNGVIVLPDGYEIKTLERPWLDNKVSVSCIPVGMYEFKRDTYGRHQWFRVIDVPHRTHIEMHEGTTPKHSEGCILMSTYDLNKMLEFYGDEELTYVLEIIDYE